MTDQTKTRGVLTCNCPAGLKAYWLHAPNCPVRVAEAALIDPYDGGTWEAAPQSPVAPAGSVLISRELLDAFVNGVPSSKAKSDARSLLDGVTTPVAPADERAAIESVVDQIKAICREKPTAANGYKLNLWEELHQAIAKLLARARLADAPKVSATVPVAALLAYPALIHGAKAVERSATVWEGFASSDAATCIRAAIDSITAAPTPPTSAADARLPSGDEVRAIVRANRSDGSDPTTIEQYVIAGWRAAIAASKEQ